jgi:carbon-monoxide dehydrogenase large subunit
MDLVAYTAVDDVGVVLNPMIVEGQIHGGVVQGVGQALGENCVYDPSSGQLLTGSFMDYQMPRADDLPPITVVTESTRCRHNPLGVKGCGEVGTIASPATVMNAVVDALSSFGITHLDMPATTQRIWNTIHGSRQAAAV